MKVLVINLARRADRWQRMTQRWQYIGLRLDRLEAMDGRCLGEAQRIEAIPDPVVACNLSHRMAWEVIAAGRDAVLVLEDDSVPDSSVKWPEFLEQAPDLLDRYGLGLLQIGFICGSRLQESLVRSRAIARRRHSTETIATWKRIAPYPAIVQHSFRSGAHAYLLTPECAEQLLNIGAPAYLPTDNALGSIAEATQLWSKIPIGRLDKGIVTQESKGREAIPHDSDVG